MFTLRQHSHRPCVRSHAPQEQGDTPDVEACLDKGGYCSVGGPWRWCPTIWHLAKQATPHKIGKAHPSRRSHLLLLENYRDILLISIVDDMHFRPTSVLPLAICEGFFCIGIESAEKATNEPHFAESCCHPWMREVVHPAPKCTCQSHAPGRALASSRLGLQSRCSLRTKLLLCHTPSTKKMVYYKFLYHGPRAWASHVS